MFTPGVKAKLETQQGARSTKQFFFLKWKLTTGPDACSLLAPYAGYGFTVAAKTIYILWLLHPLFPSLCCCKHMKMLFSLMLLKRSDIILFASVSTFRGCIAVSLSEVLIMDVSAVRELSKVFEEFHADSTVCCWWEALRSFLLNHRDIICACLLGYTNSGSSIPCWDLEHSPLTDDNAAVCVSIWSRCVSICSVLFLWQLTVAIA